MPDTELGKGGTRVPKTDNYSMNQRISDHAQCQEENEQETEINTRDLVYTEWQGMSSEELTDN